MGPIHIADTDDAALVRRILAGDTGAYAALVARYRDRLFRYATRVLGDAGDAEEALQDSFVRAFRALGRCEDPARFGAWLFRILVNRCRTIGSQRGRRERVLVVTGVMPEPGVPHPEDRAAWREAIEWALAQLGPDYREAFVMKHVEELSYEEMAELTGAGVSALKMRVKRACEQLRTLLTEVERA
jgi:RNA polymerase sigma-70 factor (ECF subfamily)